MIPWAEAVRPFHIVTVPGLDGSNASHWQTQWESALLRKNILCSRVEQEDWSRPYYAQWKQALERTLLACAHPVLLAGHSLGALLVARWGGENPLLARRVAGALLVAPADVEQHTGADRERVADFRPIPRIKLPFPAIVVGSSNDPWLSMTRGSCLAQSWGATFVSTGRNGHMGNDSNLQQWPAGLALLGQVAKRSQWSLK